MRRSAIHAAYAAIHATQLQFMREAQFMPRSGNSLAGFAAHIACRVAAHIECRVSGIYRTAQSFVKKSRSSAQYIERLCRISSALARTYIVSITAMTGLWSDIYSPSTGSSGITSDSETSQGISVKI